MSAVGLLAIVAIAMAAASVTTAVDPGFAGQQTAPGQPALNQSQGGIPTNGSGADFNRSEAGTTGVTGTTVCIWFLSSLPGTVVYFGAIAGVLGLIKRRFSLGTAVFAMYGIMPVALLGYFLTTDCAEFGGGGIADEPPVRSALEQAAATQIATPDVPPVVLVGVLGVMLIVVAAVLYTTTGDQMVDTGDEEEGAEEEEADLRDLAAAAGEAADRLEEHNADVDNEVYRAWWEMTRMLDVPNPSSATPGEFAQAAIDLGADEEDIGELTRLFEEVRYGRMDAESREELAVEVFRNIEAEYGDSRRTDRAGGDGGDADGR